MAKINELTDTQLEKAIFKYSESLKLSPSEKTQRVLQQLRLERDKRSQASKKPKDRDEISQMSKIAEAAVSKKRAKQKEKESRLKIKVKKGPGPVVSANVGNILLFSGLACGALGGLLLLDDYLLDFLPAFGGKSIIYFSLITIGVILSKVSSSLTDDNR